VVSVLQLVPSVQGKTCDLDQLAEIIAQERRAGQRIVLAHGVFDLLHIGHLRHLREAKAQGDILVVTLTEDKHVNKGPHRPAFGEDQRAEALAALEVVDYVAISRHSTAVEVINRLAPDVYVKGPDYRDKKADVTGGIDIEERAVNANGGAIYYTAGETFSSSTLLNRFMPAFHETVQTYLSEFREKHSRKEILASIEALRSMKAVVIGETILDEYVYCDQMGKSSKEPVLAMRYASKELFGGGSLAIANHLANFCQSVELITVLGDTDPQEEFIRTNLRWNVRTNFIYRKNSPTIVKRRFVDRYTLQKLFEVYVINDEYLEPDEDEQFLSLMDARIPTGDATIVADFGHGMLTPAAVDLLTERRHFLAVNTQINAANLGFHTISKYRRADFVCIHEGEIRLDARSRRGTLADIAKNLGSRLGGDVMVTQGKNGTTFFRGDEAFQSPAFTRNVVDRIGSGDAVLAITSMCVAQGMHPEIVGFLSNVIGAQKVQIVGNRHAVDRVSTLKFIESLLR
jgi:rfaE bifunctional protein nucleotidyltransferase chain/domain